MKNQILDQVIGVPVKSTASQVVRIPRRYLQDAASQYWIPSSAEGSYTFRKNKGNFVLKRTKKLGKKANTFVHGVCEHVRLGLKITETVKGKLSLGARILQLGGTDKIFKQLFSVGEGEKLMKVAFCSDRSIKIPSPKGEFLRVHYKVLVPLEKIKGVDENENMKKPSQKYMDIVTVDDFESWFMGFLNHQKAFKYLQQIVFVDEMWKNPPIYKFKKIFFRLNSMNKDRRRSSFHDITSVGNGDISIGAEAGGSFRKSAKQTPQHPAAPTIGQPIGGPLVSAVGTPVNLPTLAHVVYRGRVPVAGAVARAHR